MAFLPGRALYPQLAVGEPMGSHHENMFCIRLMLETKSRNLLRGKLHSASMNNHMGQNKLKQVMGRLPMRSPGFQAAVNDGH